MKRRPLIAACAALAAAIMLALPRTGIPLQRMPIFLQSLPFSLAAAALFLFAVGKVAGDSKSYALDRNLARWIALLFIPAGYLAEESLNAVLDASPPAAHASEIKAKMEMKSSSANRYQIILASWHPDDPPIFLAVSEDVYLKARAGTRTARILTKPGYFGHEWVVDWRVD